MKTHYGVQSIALCGASRLLSVGVTTDIQAVDCLQCLWTLLGSGLEAVDRIALRTRVVTTEMLTATPAVPS